MKKISIALIAVLGIVVLVLIGKGDGDDMSAIKQKHPITSSESTIQDDEKDNRYSSEDGNGYEKNRQQLQRFVEVIYNSTGDDKDLKEKLQNVASAELIETYVHQQGNVQEAHRYETKVQGAIYTVNATTGMALFELVTTTELNDNTQLYLLQVSYDHGVIDHVDRLARIDE